MSLTRVICKILDSRKVESNKFKGIGGGERIYQIDTIQKS